MNIKDKAIRDIKREVMYRVFTKLNKEGRTEIDPNELREKLADAIGEACKKRGIDVEGNFVEFMVNLCLLYAQYRYFGSI
jgi:hypothetical protein